MNKYTVVMNRNQYIEVTVEANSQEEARNIMENVWQDDCLCVKLEKVASEINSEWTVEGVSKADDNKLEDPDIPYDASYFVRKQILKGRIFDEVIRNVNKKTIPGELLVLQKKINEFIDDVIDNSTLLD